MIISDHGGSYMAIYDHIWSYVIMYDHIWPYMILHDQIWLWIITYMIGPLLGPSLGLLLGYSLGACRALPLSPCCVLPLGTCWGLPLGQPGPKGTGNHGPKGRTQRGPNGEPARGRRKVGMRRERCMISTKCELHKQHIQQLRKNILEWQIDKLCNIFLKLRDSLTNATPISLLFAICNNILRWSHQLENYERLLWKNNISP